MRIDRLWLAMNDLPRGQPASKRTLVVSLRQSVRKSDVLDGKIIFGGEDVPEVGLENHVVFIDDVIMLGDAMRIERIDLSSLS